MRHVNLWNYNVSGIKIEAVLSIEQEYIYFINFIYFISPLFYHTFAIFVSHLNIVVNGNE